MFLVRETFFKPGYNTVGFTFKQVTYAFMLTAYMSWNDFSLRDFSAESPKERKAAQLLLSTFGFSSSFFVFAFYFQKQQQGA